MLSCDSILSEAYLRSSALTVLRELVHEMQFSVKALQPSSNLPALSSGALPALVRLELADTPVMAEAIDAVSEALSMAKSTLVAAWAALP